MGRKLEQHLIQAGFEVTRVLTLPDAEFAFDGPARPDVIEAWSNRFERLTPLQDLCGSDFGRLKREFLAAISHPDHRSGARVYCVIGTKKT